MERYKLFVKRIGLLGVTNFLVALNTIILIPILTKNLVASDFGIWIQVNTTFFLITSIANLGFPYTMLRFLSAENNREKIQEGFYSMAALILLVSFIISIILIIFSKEIAGILFDGNVTVVIITAIAVFFGSLNSLFIDFFITFRQMKKYALLLLFQTYLSLLLISYFAISGRGIIMIILGFLITQIIIFFVMILTVFSEIGFKIPKFNNIKEYLNFSVPTIPSNLSNWIVESSDRYVIVIM
ncbi:MAG: oligosaccharide flippase family protein, partial [Methanobacterium sp.]